MLPSQAKRLSLDALVKHHTDAGDTGTFDSKTGLFPITVNHEVFLATQVFVFPKYDVTLALAYPADLTDALDLSTAETLEEKRSVLSPEGEYSYHRHGWLAIGWAGNAHAMLTRWLVGALGPFA